jgi:hypothetical protein
MLAGCLSMQPTYLGNATQPERSLDNDKVLCHPYAYTYANVIRGSNYGRNVWEQAVLDEVYRSNYRTALLSCLEGFGWREVKQ